MMMSFLPRNKSGVNSGENRLLFAPVSFPITNRELEIKNLDAKYLVEDLIENEH